jgi:hypothetical protein
MRTRLYTQTSHRFNWYAGPATRLGPPIMHTERDRERGGTGLLPRRRGKQTEEAVWSGQPRASSSRRRRWKGWPASRLRGASVCTCSVGWGDPWPLGHGCRRLRPRPSTVGEHRRRRAKEKGSMRTGVSTRTHGSSWLNPRWLEVAWPCEVGGVRMNVPAAMAFGGNWPWWAHTREVGRWGRHGGVLCLACD